MTITVFGSSGKVGRLVVAEALRRGYTVRAFTHHNNPFSDNLQLHVISGDIYNPDDVRHALKGSDAVISALGSWGSKHKDVVSKGIENIITAMNAEGLTRVVSLTGADAFDAGEKPSLVRSLSHSFGQLVAGKILRDGETHIRLLRESTLDWTVLRSPVMTNRSRIFYKLSMQPLKPWDTMPRIAIAKAMVDQTDGSTYSRSAPFIHRF